MASTFSGKVWKFGDDINTDLVIPNFAVLMTVEEQLQHCFSANRPGWVDEVKPGDVLVVGPQLRRRLGAQHRRRVPRAGDQRRRRRVVQRARACATASTPACRRCRARASSTLFEEGDIAEVDWTTGAVRNVRPGRDHARASPIPPALQDIVTAAGSRTCCAARATSRAGERAEEAQVTRTDASVTEQLAEWIVKADYADVPTVGDRAGAQPGARLARQPVRGHVGLDRAHPLRMGASAGRRPDRARSPAQDFKTTPALATLVNGAASHALENDDIATFSSHPNSPLTAATLALGREARRLRAATSSLAWLVGWEITAQTMKVVHRAGAATSSSTGAGSTRASRRRSASPRWPPGCSGSTSTRPAWRSATPRRRWPG